MFSWMSKDESRAKHGDIYEGVAEGLKGIYKYVELDHMSQVIEINCVNMYFKMVPKVCFLCLLNCHDSRQKLLPLEKEYQFHDFHSPALDDPDFDARSQTSTSVSERVIFHSRPMVMLVGQYSTGKTTFIRYLLEQV